MYKMKTPMDSVYSAIQELLKTQRLAVLATQAEGQPYASLVAFSASNDLKTILFITPRDTRKFAQIRSNPQVAVLINSSVNHPKDFERAISATAVGRAQEVSVSERDAFMKRYLVKHPNLKEFANEPASVLVKITVQSIYLVKNFQEVHTLDLSK
jgi:nitroimidazol reductase NimA-like FMN-containing flavoprotein (pyridoxamine 5'-phosphate oxidase superfamily)